MSVERWLYVARLRLRSVFRRSVVEQELDDEMRYHLERRIEAERASGLSPEQARYAALRAMDGIDQHKERSRDMRRVTLIDHTLQDLRYGWRTLLGNPGFSAVAVFTLALGIAANTIVFSVVDGVVLHPFAYPQPGRLVGIGSEYPSLDRELTFWENLSPPEFLDIASRSRSLERMVAWDMGNRQVAELGVQNVSTAFWWGDAFQTLEVAPAAGRGFLPDEIVRGDRVAVMSHRIWQARFAADPKVVGTQIHVNAEPYTVVGVMPPGTLIYGTDLWIPRPVAAEQYPRQRRQIQVLARLTQGTTVAQANRELDAIAQQIDRERRQQFREYEGWRLIAATWDDINVRTLKPAALMLLGAMAFVLLMVCANLANMLLARFTTRGREMAIRVALGAGRGRVARQLLVESLLLALCGGAAGLLLAIPAIDALGAALPKMQQLAIPGGVAVNARVLLFTFGVSALIALLVGAAPAVHAFRGDVQSPLKVDGPSTTIGPRRLRLQRTLIGVQVTLAVLLLTGAGLLIRSIDRLQHVQPGFDTRQLVTMRITLPANKYPGRKSGAFFTELVGRVERLPGISSAAAVSQFPPVAFLRAQLQVEGAAPAAQDTLPAALLTIASPRYFQTLGIPLLRGRLFDADREGTPLVAVVNDVAARRFFGTTANAIGKRFRTQADGEWTQVVGVVASVRSRGLEAPLEPEIYGSLDQRPGVSNQLFLVVRTFAQVTVIAPIRAEIQAMDADQPIYRVQTIDDAFAAAAGPRRVATVTLMVFALFALTLAAAGVYGVVSYTIAQRTQEIGIRLALGATEGRIRSLIVRHAMVPAAAGAAAGLAVALVIGRFMSGLLFEVGPRDPVTFAVVMATVLTTAAAASCIPARRATSVDPVIALRYD